MFISLAVSQTNGFLKWSQNHTAVAPLKTAEHSYCSIDEFGKRVTAEIPRLRRYAHALTRNSTTADDLVQDCLERGLAKRHLWQQETNLRA